MTTTSSPLSSTVRLQPSLKYVRHPAPLLIHSAQQQIRHFPCGAVLIEEGPPSRFCFQIISGCARAVQLMEDGRRLIGEFLLPGDMVGVEAVSEQIYTIEAVTQVTAQRHIIEDIEKKADQDRIFSYALRQSIALKLQMSWKRQIALGRQTARERLLGFLNEMRNRLDEGPRNAITLPMSRSDIADYLGLTIETICRTLTAFRREGLVSLCKSEILFLSPPFLKQDDGMRAASRSYPISRRCTDTIWV
ncbi:helix-turn-helix domain-containing protein [Granulibacter bethesdensis]|uniref:helix-turn-helix domain-containing protein n=1 Tax=Granulibacter bethesdensis TaxID=364410 RepID=UPI00090AA470|nr:helix-turn-helix domain-containing protein [Granulibacter bethesdensis]APH59994.1 Nitrogen fixation regulation protein fixK [Granulibacter bethesdensis]